MVGRPRGAWKDKAWRDALRMAALLPVDDERKGKTNLDAMALATVRAAKGGDISAAKEFGDRVDGKVAQAIVGGGEDDNPIALKFIELRAVHPK